MNYLHSVGAIIILFNLACAVAAVVNVNVWLRSSLARWLVDRMKGVWIAPLPRGCKSVQDIAEGKAHCGRRLSHYILEADL